MAEEKEKPAKKEAAPGEKKGPNKMLVLGGIVGVFLALQVGLAFVMVQMLKPEDETLKALQAEQEMDKRNKQMQTEMGAILAKPIDVTVNIDGTNGERFLKCGVQLEYDASFLLLGPELEARLAKIKNIIIDILSTKPMSELMTVEGKKAIRDAIVADVNAILPTEIDGKELGKIRRAYFDSFIIQ